MPNSNDTSESETSRDEMKRAPSDCFGAFLSSIFGNKWSLLVLYEACRGATKFNEFEERLGVSATSLTRCLNFLVDLEILGRHSYCMTPPRWEYLITAEGETIRPVIEALAAWVAEHLARRTASSGPAVAK